MWLHLSNQICIILRSIFCLLYSSGYYHELSLLKKKVNIIILFFQHPIYVDNQLYRCRLLITFKNSSGLTKCSCENACMCSLVSAFAAREESVIFFFSAHLLQVSSTDNLSTQLGHRSGPAKLSCENACLWSLIWAGFAAGEESVLFLSARFLSLIICPLVLVIL